MMNINANKTVKKLSELEIDNLMTKEDVANIQDIVDSASIPMIFLQGYDILRIATFCFLLGKTSK